MTNAIDHPLSCGFILVVGTIVFADSLTAVFPDIIPITRAPTIDTLSVLATMHGFLLRYGVYINIHQRIVTILELAMITEIPIVTGAPANGTRAPIRAVFDARCSRQVIHCLVVVHFSNVFGKGWVNSDIQTR